MGTSLTIMGTSLTRDEQLVLQLLVSGKGSEEIAAALDMPLEVVRTCTHALITRVLDESKQVPLRAHRLSHKEAAV